MNAKDVDVVVLTYRTARFAVEAARSARDCGAESITIVDNNSPDDSLDVLQRETGAFAKALALPQNGGFPYGNNAGARVGKLPLILFMNSDATLHAGALERMVHAMDRDPRIGATAPSLEYPDGRPQASAYLFIRPLGLACALLGIDKLAVRLGLAGLSGNADPTRNGEYSGPVESLYGPCFLVRRDAFEDVGGFDEAFFLYCEETDFFLRLARKGWRIHRVSDARATHAHGEAAKQAPVRSQVIMQESIKLYARKHFGPLGRTAVLGAAVVGWGARLLLSPRREDRARYRAALGAWLGWTPPADPRKGMWPA